MGEVFLKLLNMSIMAIRLLIPFSIESTFSLQPSAQPIQFQTIAEGEVWYDVPSVDSNLPIVEHTLNPILTETFTKQEENGAISLQAIAELAGYVWLFGMLVLGACAIWSVLRLHLLLLSVYWFQQLCWMAYIMLCKDIELACDEKVIRHMSFSDKKEYSKVLLSCAM